MSGARVASLVSCAALIAALGACARVGPPAPVVQGTSTPPPRVAGPALPQGTPMIAPAAAVSQTTPGEVVVRSGESLYVLARRHNVPMRAVIDANRLEPPYVLHTGQRLTLPQVRTYEVQAGDTLSGIARRFGLGTSEMVRANAIAPPYHVRTGQVLILPGGEALPGAAPPTMVASIAPTPTLPAQSSAPVVESTPVVTPAPSRPSVSAPSASVAAASPEPPPREPERETVVASLPPPTQTEAPAAAAPSAPPAPAVTEPVAVAPRAPIDPGAADDPPPKVGRGFIWPVRGTIVSDYGSKPGGLQNDGINIAAPRGTPIRAAEGGQVVYAGNELRGFGNLLLVRHRDGWITAYAHADELLVKRGDSVRRGQVIARVGSSGAVSSPQLHFEVRRGARHVNPRDHLAPQTAQAF